MVTPPFQDLRSFLRFLETRQDLRRITAPVDPELEITEIALRVVKDQGPALLFENVKGSRFPLLINVLGAERRITWALGRSPEEIGQEIKAFADDLMPPKLSALWRHRRLLGRIPKMKGRFVQRGPVSEVEIVPDLNALPLLKCWPKDGGRFITFPLVITRNLSNGHHNLGIYRMQLFDHAHTGMHWQIQKGGGFHHAEAEKRGVDLPVSVVLGADPLLMLAGIFPLPEDIDEVAFAGFLRGSPTRLTHLGHANLNVPANSEMVLEGVVSPHERRQEGPFGDHFGHYSHAAPFPVFKVNRVYHRRDAIYPAAVVGKPPQEDKYMGNAVQDMFRPLLKLMHPELVDLWAYFETGFHNLVVVSMRQRYKKEGLKTAFAILGEGQMSLTKCVILVDPEVNVRRFSDVLSALRQNFDPREDFLLLPRTSQDTLDFTGHAMNLGSKMILDATGGSYSRGSQVVTHRQPSTTNLSGFGSEVTAHRNWEDSLLIVRVKQKGREVIERLVRNSSLSGFKFIVAVSDDVPLDDDELLLWGIFTRFDCARDLIPARATFRGGAPLYEGPLGIDATWKTGYPEPLVMDPGVIQKVDRSWGQYGIN